MPLDKLNKGYLVQVSIPDSCTIDLPNLTQLAQNTGFPPEFLPRPKSPKNAFELAFNIVLGKKGMTVTPRMDVRKQKVAEFGVEPFARVQHQVSSAAAPILRRTLVEVQIVPFASRDDGQDTSKTKYLNLVKVAALEFDTETEQRTATYFADPKSWLDKGTVQMVVDEIKRKQLQIQDACVASDIRTGVRDFLISKNRIQLVHGGASYYIPDKAGMEQELENMREYVRGLGRFCGGDKPVAFVFQVAPWDSQAIEDVKQASINDLSDRLLQLKREVRGMKPPAPDADKKEFKQYDKAKSRLLGQLLEVNQAIEAVKTSLSDGLEVIDYIYDSCKSAITNL